MTTVSAYRTYGTVLLWLSRAVGCSLRLCAHVNTRLERSVGARSWALLTRIKLNELAVGVFHRDGPREGHGGSKEKGKDARNQPWNAGRRKLKVDKVSIMLRASHVWSFECVCGGGGGFGTYLGLPATPTPQWQKTPSTSAPNPNCHVAKHKISKRVLAV